MAKAKPIESLDCDANAAAMAAVVLKARYDEMMGFREAATKLDGIDGVHDMRVSSRRFRSAFRDLSHLFRKKHQKRLKEDAKKLAKTLGTIRDIDVAIDALLNTASRAPNDSIRSGIETLTSTLRDSRSKEHQLLAAKLTQEAVSDLDKLAAEAFGSLGKKEASQGTSFREASTEFLHSSLDEFLVRTKALYEPQDANGLHKLRISAKRLRYGLELLAPCLGDEASSFVRKLKKIQSCLGSVHDCDHWIDQIDSELKSDREAAEWLIADFHRLRADEYTQALELWKDSKSSDLKAKLLSILSR
ncbi:MAG TPA: CHAD domain-containing protein [Pyrinomonadaceae bacterium]|nr:CHAD domain-containing protein [Pyrinomonadaceae bacterium]